MQEQGRAPSLPALNNLINAHGRASRLGDVVSLVEDLAAAGMRPDAFTFAAILNACQRANEAELAFDVYRQAPQSGVITPKLLERYTFHDGAHKSCLRWCSMLCNLLG